MACVVGPNPIKDNMVLLLDVANVKSYPAGGPTWTDITGNGFNGTLAAGVTYDSDNISMICTGATNSGVDFDNVDDSSMLSVTSNFTIEQYFKVTDYQLDTYYGLTNTLFSKGNASTFNYATQVKDSTTVSFIKRGGAESLQHHEFTVPSLTNNVVQIVFVVIDGDVICYHNGGLIGNLAITGERIEAQSSDPVDISGVRVDGEGPFIGNYYNLRVYNKALTASEVSQNFQAYRGRFGI